MSTLALVRHGQARPFTGEPDELSPIGRRQAEILGGWWARQGVAFDEIISGTLERQRQTAATAIAAAREAGMECPALQTVPAWNEFDAEGVLKLVVPALADREPGFRSLVAAFERNRGHPEQNRYFQRMFEAAMSRWSDGRVSIGGIEPWSAFRQRVRGALKDILDGDRGSRRVLVVTSGGPIGISIQTILEAPERTALTLNWRVRNCSITEVLFNRDRVSLDCFNALPHLSNPELVTFR